VGHPAHALLRLPVVRGAAGVDGDPDARGDLLAKGRVLLGVIGVFIPVVAFFGAVRLAHPASIWAKRRYGDARMAKAHARFDPDKPMMRAGRRLGDLIAGRPTDEIETPKER
jgi:hypothetical protein